jgi:formate/nitrite transporter FocA (FNT family)
MQQQPTYTLNNLTEKEVKLIGESRAPKRSVKINLIAFFACVVISLLTLFALSVAGQTANKYADISLLPLAASLIFMGRMISIRDKAGKSFLDQVKNS